MLIGKFLKIMGAGVDYPFKPPRGFEWEINSQIYKS